MPDAEGRRLDSIRLLMAIKNSGAIAINEIERNDIFDRRNLSVPFLGGVIVVQATAGNIENSYLCTSRSDPGS
jgi:hypothetical protein